jgi:hypothetical protein
MCELRYLAVAGVPSEMGEAQGEEYRDEIHDFVSRRIAHLVDFVRKYDPGSSITEDDVIRIGRSLIDAHRGYDVALWNEFLGIARGARIPEARLLVGNGLTDIRDLVLMDGLGQSKGGLPDARGGDPGGCTSFGATAEATGRASIVGQTWDMHPDARHFLLVVRREPVDAPSTLSLTTVGCLCLSGVNSEGVAVCNSNLVSTDARTGVNYLFTISRALRAGSAAEAADLVECTRRLSGHDFMIADTGSVVDVETTATLSHRATAAEGVLVHSNHYADEDLREHAFEGIDISSSVWRREHLDSAFRSAARPIDRDLCWELLSDSTREDGAVCNEDYEGEFADVATAATTVIETDTAVLTACAGGARLGNRREFHI